MKSILLLVLLLCAGFSSSAQFDSVVVSHEYTYSDANGLPYGLHFRYENHYDSLQRITSVLSDKWDGYKFYHEYKEITIYDGFGNKIEETVQLYSGYNPVNSTSKRTYINSFNKTDSILYLTWNGSAWAINSRVDFSYNVDHHLIFKQDGGYRGYFYPDATNKDTATLTQSLVNSIWTNYNRARYFYNANGKMNRLLGYKELTPGTWTLQDSTSYSYYTNDSLFVTYQYSFNPTAHFDQADSIVYDGDTVRTYTCNQQPINYTGRVSNYQSSAYNYYHTEYEYYDGTSWNYYGLQTSEIDSAAHTAHQESTYSTGGSSSEDITFDSDWHLITASHDYTSHSGNYSYGNSYYYYYLTNGSDDICPGTQDSLWIIPGMTSYSWNHGGTTNHTFATLPEMYNCNIVNQYGHPFPSEPHYIMLNLSPTATHAADSSFTVCPINYMFTLSTFNLPVYNYQWLRNDSVIPGPAFTSPELRFWYTYAPTISAEYKLVVSNVCGSDTSSATNLYFAPQQVKITPAGHEYLCPGDTIFLTADPGFVSYVWDTGDSGRFVASYAGHINRLVIAIDTIGCESRNSKQIDNAFLPGQLPLKIYQQQDSILLCNTFSSGIFQWYRNGVAIPGATIYKLIITQSGNYKYSYDNGICQVMSEEKFFTFTHFRVAFNNDSAVVCYNTPLSLNNWYHISGGIPPYHYHWTPSTGLSNDTIAGPTLTSLTNTSYVLTITDSTGAICSDTMKVYANHPVIMTLTSSADSVCDVPSGNDYWDTLRVNYAGAGWYQWSSTGPSMNGSDTVKTIYQAGKFWMTYYNGCSNRSDTVTIGTYAPLPHPNIHLYSTPANWCQTDSVVLVADLLNASQYQIEWKYWNDNTVLPSTTTTAVAHAGGQYSFYFTDQHRCHGFESFNTFDVSGDTTVPFSVVPGGTVVGCFGDTVTLTSTNYPGWNYTWQNYDDLLIDNDNIYKVIYSGNYKVSVDNTFGCHGEDSVYVSMSNNHTNVSLVYNGYNLVATPDGYVNNWRWYRNNILLPNANQPSLHPVVAGWYRVQVNAGSQCGTSVDSVQITCAISSTTTNPLCDTMCNGNISVIATGISPYSYLWSNALTTSTITALCPGIYVIHMTDSTGCIASDSIILSSPTPLAVTPTYFLPTCYNSCDGSIAAFASGGNPPYSYQWSPSFPACAGNYDLYVIDDNGCGVHFPLILPDAPAITYQDTITNASCSTCSDGSATITPGGGMPPYVISWNTGDSTNTITNELPDTYNFCITDAHQCLYCGTIAIGFGIGIEEKSNTGIRLQPNPFNDFTEITFDKSLDLTSSKMYIINSFGEIVSIRKINQERIIIKGAEYSNGVYYLEIRNEKQLQARKKMIVVH